ncbi:MAG TPA: hypothetical protein PLX71_06090 [Phycicoccus sp.]|nr:hypothetical protein [Phycicoccus sp.]
MTSTDNSPSPTLGTSTAAASDPVVTPDAWEAIVQQLRSAEDGMPPAGPEVVLRPGGAVDLVKDGEVVQPASRLPRDVMAGA